MKSLKKYLEQKLTNQFDSSRENILVSTLVVLFILYWLNPNSREAHFDRTGTIQSPALLTIVPIFLLLFSFFLIFLVKAGLIGSRFSAFQPWRIGRFSPVISFLLFAAVPYFSAYFGWSKISNFYYHVLRVSNIEPTFADLRTILYGISCPDVNVLGDEITCDPRGSTTIWNYPTILLYLRNFGVGINLLLSLAIVFTLVVTIAILLISNSLSASGRIWLTVLVCSPPVLLCFNRMNFDLLIVSLVVLAIAIISKPRATLSSFFVALCLLSFASILKFYAFPLLVLVALRFSLNSKYSLMSFMLSSLTFFFMFRDLMSVREYVGRDIRGSVGLSVLTSLLNGADTASLNFLTLGFATCFLAILFLSLILFCYSRPFSSLSFVDTICFSLSILFLIPWFTTSSYYYRLVVLVFLIPILIANHRQSFQKAVFVVAALALYLSPSSLAFIQNVLVLPLVCFLIIFAYVFLSQVKNFLVKGGYG